MVDEVKTRVAPEAPEVPETPRETPGLQPTNSDIPQMNDVPENIEIWESENRREYAQDYFKIREFVGEFPLKVQYKFVDKYVKGELEERGWEKSVKNWEKIIGELEDEIGSKELTQFKRMQKLFSYIQVVKKMQDLKKKKELYKQMTG